MKNYKEHLDELDHSILEQLLKDARTPYLEIARSCGVSGATVHLRIKKLEDLGLIKGSRLIIDYQALGLGICAYLGIHLEKVNDVELFAKLKEMPEVVECHFTTGMYSLFLKVYCRDTTHLRDLLVEKLQTIGNIRRTETFISLEQAFERVPNIDTMLDR